MFLFEEPESFLHENHQEYFYKMVLCKLAENHQVIYTTHSDKMLDIFDTKGLIRIEHDERNGTKLKYNKANDDFNPDLPDKIVSIKDYNNYIKFIEPNLNKILFSKKVVLVEGANDLLVYNKLIEKKVFEKIKGDNEIIDKQKYSETYRNFKNISIIPHHGKSTALYLIQLCKYLGLEYFVINDWDFDYDFQDRISLDFDKLKEDSNLGEIEKQENNKGKKLEESTIKGMITTNRNLIDKSGKENIHFNVKKLETLIGYDSSDKNSYKIYEIINKEDFEINEKIFPESLEIFLELKEKELENSVENNEEINIEDVPF